MAHGTRGEPVVLFGSGAGAGFAGIRARHLQVGREAPQHVLKTDFEIITKVLPALYAAAPAPAAATTKQVAEPEEIAENIAEIREGVRIDAARGALQSLKTVAIVSGAFLRIAQNAIRLRGLFESLFGILVTGVPVRMVLERKLAVSTLQCRVVGLPIDAKDSLACPGMADCALGDRGDVD